MTSATKLMNFVSICFFCVGIKAIANETAAATGSTRTETLPDDSCVETKEQGVVKIRGSGNIKFGAEVVCTRNKIILNDSPGLFIGTAPVLMDGDSDPNGLCLALNFKAPGTVVTAKFAGSHHGGHWTISKFNSQGQLESAKRVNQDKDSAEKKDLKFVKTLTCSK